MLKVGIIGCGRIADQHATEIQKIKGYEIIGVCDREELMAKQMSDRFDIKHYFNDVYKLLELGPDIVHITTPPQSHFELGKLCIEAGCHVFIEKPFTINTAEAENLISIAIAKKLKLTVGHNAQFNHATMRMRELIKGGHLGGDPVHMESIWCYSFGDPGYAKTILGDSNHWIRSLPGRYLHDIISHGISRLAEFFKNDYVTVIAHGFVSPFLQSIKENDIIDELRVIINDNGHSTSYFTFSSQISPPIKKFRIYGPKKSLIVDDMHQTVIEVTGNFKSYLNHFIPPLVDAKQYMGNSLRNIRKFARKDFYFEQGRRTLIESFYRSVSEGSPLPIPYREILLTSKIMDAIFDQIYFK